MQFGLLFFGARHQRRVLRLRLRCALPQPVLPLFFGLLLLLPAVFLLQWLPAYHALRFLALLLLQPRVLLLQFQPLLVAWPESLPGALIPLQFLFVSNALSLRFCFGFCYFSVTLFIHEQSYCVV